MTSCSGLGFSNRKGGRPWKRTSAVICSRVTRSHPNSRSTPRVISAPTAECRGDRVRPVSGSIMVVAGLPESCNKAVNSSFSWAARSSAGQSGSRSNSPQTILVCVHTSPSACHCASCWQAAISRAHGRAFAHSRSWAFVARVMSFQVFKAKCPHLWRAGSEPFSVAASARSVSLSRRIPAAPAWRGQ